MVEALFFPQIYFSSHVINPWLDCEALSRDAAFFERRLGSLNAVGTLARLISPHEASVQPHPQTGPEAEQRSNQATPRPPPPPATGKIGWRGEILYTQMCDEEQKVGTEPKFMTLKKRVKGWEPVAESEKIWKASLSMAE